MKFAVEPASEDVRVPPHPIEGPMDPGGSDWIADQYTLRLIRDGVIRRKTEAEKAEPVAAVERKPPTLLAVPAASVAKPAPATAGPKE